MINQQEDTDKLETVICLEQVLDICYQALSQLIHNQAIRRECQHFRCYTEYHQEELRRMYPLSQDSESLIKSKVNKYLLLLDPPYLFLGSVISLAISLAAHKRDIYGELLREDGRYRDAVWQLLKDSAEEMDFLRRERELYANEFRDMELKLL